MKEFYRRFVFMLLASWWLVENSFLMRLAWVFTQLNIYVWNKLFYPEKGIKLRKLLMRKSIVS